MEWCAALGAMAAAFFREWPMMDGGPGPPTGRPEAANTCFLGPLHALRLRKKRAVSRRRFALMRPTRRQADCRCDQHAKTGAQNIRTTPPKMRPAPALSIHSQSGARNMPQCSLSCHPVSRPFLFPVSGPRAKRRAQGWFPRAVYFPSSAVGRAVQKAPGSLSMRSQSRGTKHAAKPSPLRCHSSFHARTKGHTQGWIPGDGHSSSPQLKYRFKRHCPGALQPCPSSACKCSTNRRMRSRAWLSTNSFSSCVCCSSPIRETNWLTFNPSASCISRSLPRGDTR